MKMTKISKKSKLVASGVVTSLLLTAGISSFASPLSLMQVEQGSLKSGSGSMWSAMSQHFNIDPQAENNPAVSKQIAYLEKHQDSLAKTLSDAAPYISYVYAKTQQSGLPAELALLPIVESDYNPNVKSPVGAAGLWQIMPGTGGELGLKSGQGYDGRRDIVASTDAALGYLNSLHNMFKKDWELALAAYNWGPGNIQKTEKKCGQVSFWDLKKLPQETQQYVPKLLALAAVIKNPARYHIQLPAMSAQLQVALLKVAPQVDLKKVAQERGISVNTMRKLNPGYQNLATTQNSPNTVLIPVNPVATVMPEQPVLAMNTVASTVDHADLGIKAPAKESLATQLLNQSKWLIIGLASPSNA